MLKKKARHFLHSLLLKHYFIILFLLSYCVCVNAQHPDTLFKQADHLLHTDTKVKAAGLRFQQADSLYVANGDTLGHVSCLWAIAFCYQQFNKWDEAEQLSQSAGLLMKNISTGKPKYKISKAHFYAGLVMLFKQSYKESKASITKSLDYYQSQSQIDRLYLGHIYLAMCKIAWYMQRYEESFAYAKKTVEEFEGGQAGMAKLFTAYSNLGAQYLAYGNLDSAITCYEKLEIWLNAQSQLPKNLSKTEIIGLYNNFGAVYGTIGDYSKAIEYLYKAITINERNANIHKRKFPLYKNLGEYYLLQHNETEAIRCYEKALSFMDSTQAEHNNWRIDVMSQIAYCYAKLDKEEQAQLYWNNALAKARAVETSEELAIVYFTMANSAMDKARYSEAFSYYEKIIMLLTASQGENFAQLSEYYGSAAAALNKLGRHEEAMTYVAKALRLHCPTENCFESEKRIPKTGEIFLSEFLLNNLHEKCKAILGLWRNQTVNQDLLKNARNVSEQALRAAAFFRKNYQKSGAESYEWLRQMHQTYTLAVEVARQCAQIEQNIQPLETAFQIADQSRAVLMSESARNADARTFAGVPAELLTQEQRLRGLVALHEGRNQEADEQEDLADKHYRDSILFDLRRAQERLTAHMEREYPQYYQLRYDNRPIDIAQLRKNLPPDAALIEYLVNEEEKTLYIFVVDRANGVRLHAQPWNENTAKQILQLHQRAQSVLIQRKAIRELFIAESHALYGQLIQPILPYLEGKKQLIIVAEGDLNYVPFEMLVESPESKSFDQLPYLLRRYDISYQYAATLYLRHIQTAKKPEGAPQNLKNAPEVLAFAPVFGTVDHPQGIMPQNRVALDTALRAAKGDYFQPLPYSEKEVRNIADLFGKQRTTVLLGQAANEANLKAALEKPYRIVHLSTHSFANKNRPKFSGIACYQQENNAENGILYANEIYNLPAAAELVVLSSCESGVGKSGGGEGLLGLNRAFAYAGVPNVLYSLWKVNDKATSELMTAFYKEILAGKPYAAALRAAKLKMLENPVTASPNFWSGFLLMGR